MLWGTKLGSSAVDEEEMGKIYDFTDGERIEDVRFVTQDGSLDARTVLETVTANHADKLDEVIILAEGVGGFYLFSSTIDQRSIAFLLQLGLDRVMEKYKDD